MLCFYCKSFDSGDCQHILTLWDYMKTDGATFLANRLALDKYVIPLYGCMLFKQM